MKTAQYTLEYLSTMNLFIKKMQQCNLPDEVIHTFLYYYKLLKDGKTGYIHERDINPVTQTEIPDYAKLGGDFEQSQKAIQETIIIKLNGGLGTTMGLKGAKSLIPVKNDLTFLDITSQQTIALSKKYGFKIPLLLMNSFKTEEHTRQMLQQYPELKTQLPQSFLQHKFPKVLVSDFKPAFFPENPDLEWNPPGHGDLYTALITSGILDKLLNSGYKHAFISNIDNLGASLDIKILNYFVSKQYSFLMEVTDRTWMDRKGGHLARLKENGRLILRESNQCPPEDMVHFKNISCHSFFNTNNLWINLTVLKTLLDKNNGHLELPMIRNRKRLNPVDQNTPEVFQIESAMGSAISIFENSEVMRVPRNRFAPVKNCEELLLLWSDRFVLDEYYQIFPNPHCNDAKISINLDPRFYSWIEQINERFPFGAPSLCKCDSLTINGDVTFGKNISISDSVTITNKSTSKKYLQDDMVINTSITL